MSARLFAPLIALLIASTTSFGGLASASAHDLGSFSVDCGADVNGRQFDARIGDTITITFTGPCAFTNSAAGVLSWSAGGSSNPTTLPSGTSNVTFSIVGQGVTRFAVADDGLALPFEMVVYSTDLGVFTCASGPDQDQSVSGAVGDEFTVYFIGTCDLTSDTPGVLSWTDGASSDTPRAMNELVTLTLLTSGTSTFSAQEPAYPGSGGRLRVIVRSSSAPALSVTRSAPAPIPAWVQAVGRPGASAGCEPGWGPSWQQWAVPITGGWVCTRSIPAYGR